MKVAVVGTGFISVRKHIPALLAVRDRAELVALVDRNEDAARQTARQFGVASVYGDLREMLMNERPDVVHVCTPPRTHVDIATEAVEAGCNVLIEKPMALSTDECDRIIAAATDAGVKVCVAHSDLFYPPVVRARRLIEQGAIGRFTGMRILLLTPTDYMTSQEDHWAHRLPGGVIGETGPHAVYLTLAFIPAIREVDVRAGRLLEYPWSLRDDYRIELVGDDATSSIALVYTTDQWAAEVDLWGTGGLIRLDLELMSVVQHRRPALDRRVVATSGLRGAADVLKDTMGTATSLLTRRYRDTHRTLVERFLDSVILGGPPPVSAEEGREAVRVMALIVDDLDSNSRTRAEAPVDQ